MTTMDKIREAVDALDIRSDIDREAVLEWAVARHLGLRAVAQGFTELANDAQLMADEAREELLHTDASDTLRLPAPEYTRVTAHPIRVQTDQRGSTILVMLFAGDNTVPMVEYIYDHGTGELTRKEPADA